MFAINFWQVIFNDHFLVMRKRSSNLHGMHAIISLALPTLSLFLELQKKGKGSATRDYAIMAKENRSEFEAGPWRVLVTKSHILRSKCERGLDEGCSRDDEDKCNVCR